MCVCVYARVRACVYVFLCFHTEKKPINPFTLEFLNWTFPSLNLDAYFMANTDLSQKPKLEQQTV